MRRGGKPSIDAILANRDVIERVLVACGIRGCELHDVLQECILGALVAVRAGRYKPAPHVPPRRALARWLAGIAFRQAQHFVTKAYRRYEILVPDPWEVPGVDIPAIMPDGRLEARAALRDLRRIPGWARDILHLAAVAKTNVQIAADLGVQEGTVRRRLRIARRRFAHALAGRRR